ncbi:alpha/beta hydrolase [Polycladomyces sp. WAk]|uniref:Alpha/beta hydrolase n=1 Tax=Polycladomyces zharkentensis TaxID=2807616 RepID=A0ABS2WIW2_9BACL|nr:alpha/beta hydrolase [Polycladomyces sp. WAk]MBN2909487.1 alpha/beta hydrolase [Polycladomyces sp. WAk]
MATFKEKTLAAIIRWRAKSQMAKYALRPSTVPKVQFEERFVPTPVGDSRVLVYRPLRSSEGSLPVYVNFHGGGFILGSAEMDDVWCRVIADRADCVVVNVDYRLAPEHPFPTALEEGYGVIRWMYDQPGQLGINRERIAVGGHSAGGNLAAAICLLARERSEFPITLQILDYPPLDLATDPYEKPTHPQAIPPWLAAIFNGCYLPSPEQARNPLASPIYAESLAGLPSALIITAEFDSLAPEAERYAQRLREAGIAVSHKRYEGAVHGFTHSGPLELAEDAWELIITHLQQAFGK